MTIATDLPKTGQAGASQIISVTPLASREYYLAVGIDDGVNPVVYNVSNQPFRVNRKPTLTFTSPVNPNTPPDSITGDRDVFTIRWMALDPDDTAKIALYYDTDNVGFDGTLIVENLNEGSNTTYAWDASGVPGGSYYIYAVIADPYNDPVRVYSAGTFQVDSDHKPRLTIHSPFSGDDTWDRNFTIQWEDYDFDSNAQISFYIQNATPGFDGTEELIVGGISEDNEDDFYIWDISSATNSTIEIIGVIRDASWEVVATAPRPLKILHSTDANLKPTLVFVDPHMDLLPEAIKVSNQRVRGTITSATDVYTIRFVAFDLENPAGTTIDLYWDSDGSTPNGTLIASDLTIGTNGGVTSYDWDISSVAGGTYYFYGTIFDGVNDRGPSIRAACFTSIGCQRSICWRPNLPSTKWTVNL